MTARFDLISIPAGNRSQGIGRTHIARVAGSVSGQIGGIIGIQLVILGLTGRFPVIRQFLVILARIFGLGFLFAIVISCQQRTVCRHHIFSLVHNSVVDISIASAVHSSIHIHPPLNLTEISAAERIVGHQIFGRIFIIAHSRLEGGQFSVGILNQRIKIIAV